MSKAIQTLGRGNDAEQGGRGLLSHIVIYYSCGRCCCGFLYRKLWIYIYTKCMCFFLEFLQWRIANLLIVALSCVALMSEFFLRNFPHALCRSQREGGEVSGVDCATYSELPVFLLLLKRFHFYAFLQCNTGLLCPPTGAAIVYSAARAWTGGGALLRPDVLCILKDTTNFIQVSISQVP